MIKKLLLDTDPISEINKLWRKIDPVYKQAFFIIFIALNIVFSLHTFGFLWSEHDWGAVDYQISLKSHFSVGRFSIFIIPYLFQGGVILPVLNSIIGFAGLSLGVLALLTFWKVPKKLSNFLIVGLPLVLMPYTLVRLRVIHEMNTHLWLPFIAISALILSEKVLNCKKFIYKIIYNVSACLLLIFCFGAYLGIAANIAVVLTGRVLIDRLTLNLTLKQIFLKYYNIFLNIATAGACTYFIWCLLANANLLEWTEYTTISLSWERIFNSLIAASFKQFVVSMPFIELKLKLLLLIICLVAFWALLSESMQKFIKHKHSIAAFITDIAIFVCMIFLTRLIPALSMHDKFFFPTYDYYGLAYFYAFCIAFLIIVNRQIYRSIVFILVVAVLCISIHADFYAQKVWKLGFDAEVETLHDILNDITEHPDFDKNKQYVYINIGKPTAMAAQYYTIPKTNIIRRDDYPFLINESIVLINAPHRTMNFYYSKDVFKKGYTLNRLYYEINFVPAQVFNDLSEFILKSEEIWPDKSAIYINDTYVAVIQNYDDLNTLKQVIKRDLPKKYINYGKQIN